MVALVATGLYVNSSNGQRLRGTTLLAIVCRDRASKSTENALQLAHEDNMSGLAMELLLNRAAQEQGVEFAKNLPLVPTLQEVAAMRSSDAKENRAGGRGTRSKKKKKLRDFPEGDECTFFLGGGEVMKMHQDDTRDAMNAIGFFLYTQCCGNKRGEWPPTLGALTVWRWCDLQFESTAVEATAANCPWCCAAVGNWEAASSARPARWSAELQPTQLAGLFNYEMYGRATVDNECYVTSVRYKATQTRDNRWIAFQHILGAYALLLLCTYDTFTRLAYHASKFACMRSAKL